MLGRAVRAQRTIPPPKTLKDSLTNGNEITVDGWDQTKGLFVRYIPNIRPNRRHKGYHGRSDLQGIEPLLDSLDETYTSWMRDIRLGQARIIVERQYLESMPGEPQTGSWFNLDREMFTPMELGDPNDVDHGITPIQFDIRTQDHYDTCMAIREEAVVSAGYSPQTFMPRFEGTAESGTARRMRERKCFSTTGKKERYIRQPFSEMMEILLFLDKTVFGRPTPVLQPRMNFSDAAGEGPREMAETAGILAGAQAASTQTLVTMVHPDWSEEEIDAEVARILEEKRATVPDLFVPGDEG